MELMRLAKTKLRPSLPGEPSGAGWTGAAARRATCQSGRGSFV